VLTPAPLVTVLSGLPLDQRAAIDAVAAPLTAEANLLPLIVHDEFANNEYGRMQNQQTFAGGDQCSWVIGQGTYDMAVHSVNGGAYCKSGLLKTAANFILTVDLHLRDEKDSDIGLLFRFLDDQHHYELVYHPRTQAMSLSFVGSDGATPIFPLTYIAEIHPSGSNHMTVLALGNSILVSDSSMSPTARRCCR
jgi:hypothetical protein